MPKKIKKSFKYAMIPKKSWIEKNRSCKMFLNIVL